MIIDAEYRTLDATEEADAQAADVRMALPNIEDVLDGIQGVAYEDCNCFQLLVRVYESGLGIPINDDPETAAKSFVETWYEDDERDAYEVSQPWDIWFLWIRGEAHVAIVANASELVHSRPEVGVCREQLVRWRPFLKQIVRPVKFAQTVAEDFPETKLEAPALPRVRVMVSPVKGQYGELRCEPVKAQAGKPLSEILRRYKVDCIIRDGQRIDEWQDLILGERDDIIVVPETGIVGALIPILIQLAIALTLSYISYRFLGQPQPKDAGELEVSTTYTGTGIRSTEGYGPKIQTVYGRHRVGVHWASRKVRYANIYHGLGDPVNIFNITGCSGGNDKHDPILLQVPGHNLGVGWINVAGITGKVLANGSWLAYPLPGDILRLAESEGKDDRAYTGGGQCSRAPGSGAVPVEASSVYDLVGFVAAGPIQDIDISTLELNDQKIQFFQVTSIDYTRGDGTVLAGAITADNTFGVVHRFDSPAGLSAPYFYQTTSPVVGFDLNIDFDGGLGHLDDQGNVQSNWVEIGFNFNINNGPYTGLETVRIQQQTANTCRISIRKTNLAEAVYTIAVHFTAALHSGAQDRFVPTLTSVTEMVDTGIVYPDIAMIRVQGMFSDRLHDEFPNLTVEVLGKKVRVGSFSGTRQYSTNPAWCIMDAILDQKDGFQFPQSAVSLPDFQSFANYCDTVIGGKPRISLNIVLGETSEDSKFQHILEDMLRGSNGVMLNANGQYIPRSTSHPGTPQYLINGANCRNVQVTATRDLDRTNLVEVVWYSPAQRYERTTSQWPQTKPAGPEVKKSYEVRGVTDPDQILRWAQFQYKLMVLTGFTITFEMPHDAFLLQKWDVVGFSDQPVISQVTSGMVGGGGTSSPSRIYVDETITIASGTTYHVYVTHPTGNTEVRTVANAAGTYNYIDVQTSFSETPEPGITTYAFGRAAPVDTAIRWIRILDIQYTTDGFAKVQAQSHNPAMFTSDDIVPLPAINSLPYFAAPPPPILTLYAYSERRQRADKSPYYVVVLEWTVDNPSRDYAPYYRADIQRRQVQVAAHTGIAEVGSSQVGERISSKDLNQPGFFQVGQVDNAATKWEDPSVSAGSVYVYRVVPKSQRDIKNNNGAEQVTIEVTAIPTPPPPAHLRLFVHGLSGSWIDEHIMDPGIIESGPVIFNAQDVAFGWDAPPFAADVAGYNLEIHTGDGGILLKSEKNMTNTLYPYSAQDNLNDARRLGYTIPFRDLMVLVWSVNARGTLSAAPAKLLVRNPPIDLSHILPVLEPIIGGAVVKWDFYVPPADIYQWEVYIDTYTPPTTLYDTKHDTAIGAIVDGLKPGVQYYCRIAARDTYGPSASQFWSQTRSFIPATVTTDMIDNTPPPTWDPWVTGKLTIGYTTSSDGTTLAYIQVTWDDNPALDLSHYIVAYRYVGVDPEILYTEKTGDTQSKFKIDNLPGGITVAVKLAAVDKFFNQSPYTAERQITISADRTTPLPILGINATGGFKQIILFWTPPLTYATIRQYQIYASQSNNRDLATLVGSVAGTIFTHKGLGHEETWYYWVRAESASGAFSDFIPAGITGGVSATTTKIDDPDIVTVAADKLIAGTITATIWLAVGVAGGSNPAGRVLIQGTPSPVIRVTDRNGVNRAEMGAIGGGVNPTDYGIRVFNANGAIMFDATSGGVTANGVQTGAITAQHITTSTAVITNSAQIGALVVDGPTHLKDLTVDTIKIKDGAITSSVGASINNGLHAMSIIEDPVIAVGLASLANGILELYGEIQMTLNTGFGTLKALVRIREDSITGNILATRMVQRQFTQNGNWVNGAITMVIPISYIAGVSNPIPIFNKVYLLTVQIQPGLLTTGASWESPIIRLVNYKK